MSAAEFSAAMRQRIAANNKIAIGNVSVADNPTINPNIVWTNKLPVDSTEDDLAVTKVLNIVQASAEALSRLKFKSEILASATKNIASNELINVTLSAEDFDDSLSTLYSEIDKWLDKFNNIKLGSTYTDITTIKVALIQLKASMQNNSQNIEKILTNTFTGGDTGEFLLNFRSSDSALDKLQENFENILSNKPEDTSIINTGTLVVGAISTGISKELIKLTKAVAKAKEKIKKANKRARDAKGQFFSLASLLTILNEKLHDQIKKNMGKGSAKSILNYRTGRFANSVEVTRLTMTKDSAIQAFYTYQKYPYQTFEPGFKQGDPPSRNPKLLIGKSIREIAKAIVTNRLKAILV
jgi:hypothetical protein